MKPSSISTTTGTPWQFRGVQLDLARQRENLESIQQFISFARDWGYNTLVLYLEGVIRTESFSFRATDQSYTPDEISRIVQMAQSAGLDVIPCIPTLGHAEHFVECDELHHLQEDGPWSTPMFCCSNEETYCFLERYIEEIATLFPGKHFHIGGDEAWNLGACPTCKRRIENGATREDLLVMHIERIHGILGRLGKRVWIWDDLFENDLSGDKISRLPRDVVLCTWHYHAEGIDYSGFQGHFNNLQRLNALSLYNAFGFDVVVCPCYRGIENTIALTEVAREHRVLGGLQTLWVMGETFLPVALTSVALAGALWSAPERNTETVLAETVARLYLKAEPEVLLSIRAAMIELFWTIGSPQEYLRGRMTLEEIRTLNHFVLIEGILRRQLEALPPGLGREILEEHQINIRLQIIAGRLRKILPQLVDPRVRMVDRLAIEQEVEAHRADLCIISTRRQYQWEQFRAGIKPIQTSKRIDALAHELGMFLAHWRETPTERRALLTLSLFLWDAHGLPWLKVEIGGAFGWREIYYGCFKQANLRDLAYTLQIPIELEGSDPERLRLTVTGHGGQGVRHTSIAFHDRTLVPSAICNLEGNVSSASALLRDDSSVCFLGSPNLVETLIKFRKSDAAAVEILLGQQENR